MISIRCSKPFAPGGARTFYSMAGFIAVLCGACLCAIPASADETATIDDAPYEIALADTGQSGIDGSLLGRSMSGHSSENLRAIPMSPAAGEIGRCRENVGTLTPAHGAQVTDQDQGMRVTLSYTQANGIEIAKICGFDN